MIKLKKIISSFVAMNLILGCLQSIAYANGTSVSVVTWKEAIGNTEQSVTETYDSATGTFKDAETSETTARGIVNTAGTDASKTYMFGAELPTAVKSGTVVVNAQFKDVIASTSTPFAIFQLADETQSKSFASGLGFAANVPGSYRNNANQELFESRWNRDLVSRPSSGWTTVSDTDKVIDLKFVVSSQNEEADWEIKVYHDETSETVHFFSYTISRSELPDIKYIRNSNWAKSYGAAGSTVTGSMTVSKFQVKTFSVDFGADFAAQYVPDANDYNDRVVNINVSGTDIADVNAVDVYIVKDGIAEDEPLDASKVSYENGALEITVPTEYFGNLRIDLVLKTELKDFRLEVPLTGDPFIDEYIGQYPYALNA